MLKNKDGFEDEHARDKNSTNELLMENTLEG